MKKINLAAIITGLSIVVWVCTSAYAAVYYVDAGNGNDSNSGTSSAQPWKSLSKVTNSAFSPADSILLKRGEQWTESLRINSSGSKNSLITIAAYGTGKAPIIRDITIYGNFILVENIIVDASSES